MAKKYLLYIHHEKFDSEAKKSMLVNALLAGYYHRVIPSERQYTPACSHGKTDKCKTCGFPPWGSGAGMVSSVASQRELA